MENESDTKIKKKVFWSFLYYLIIHTFLHTSLYFYTIYHYKIKDECTDNMCNQKYAWVT